jgi:hypothetical protein
MFETMKKTSRFGFNSGTGNPASTGSAISVTTVAHSWVNMILNLSII